MSRPENTVPSSSLPPRHSAGDPDLLPDDQLVRAPDESPAAAPRRGFRGSLAFALKAIEIRLRFIAALVAVGLVIGYWDTVRNYWDKWTRPTVAATEVDPTEEFFCPMHPSVVRGELEPDGGIPKCPICGMFLSKREKGKPEELPPGVVARAQFSPERVQQAGIETASIEYRPLVRELRTVGFVDYDESRLSQVVTRVAGYVEKLYVNKTFETVGQGDPLAEIYSPELYSGVRELLLARERNLGGLADSARQKLRLLGVGDAEIDELLKQGRAEQRLVLRSPRQGHVIGKHVVEGASVSAGMVLLEVADLSVVWIEADVFEKDVPFLREGQQVQATVESYPGRVFEGRVALIHPHFEIATRTNRVRFELENPRHELRPGMYATVRLRMPVAEIEPFVTQIAQRRNRPDGSDLDALAAWQQTCPVTGLKLGSMGAPVSVLVDAQTVLLCCQGCEGGLQESPDAYLTRLALPPDDAVLAVPEMALIDTGTRKVVYVERQPGLFDGVEVTVGPRTGEFYPVLSGLLPGDRVAARGAFLIDAETRLKSSAATYFGASGSHGSHESGRSATRRQPADRDADSPPPRPQQPEREQELSPKQLEQITKLPPADQQLALAQKLCPVTGQPLGSMGVPSKLTLDGHDVFLCCIGCESKAKSDAASVLKKVKPSRANH